MVTGDNQATAEALADDLDIALDRVIAGMLYLSSLIILTILITITIVIVILVLSL